MLIASHSCVSFKGSLRSELHLNYSLPSTNTQYLRFTDFGTESELPRLFCRDEMIKVE